MTVHTPISVGAPDCGGLLDRTKAIEVLKASIRVGPDGQIIGIEEAVSRLVAETPAHIRVLSEFAAERQRQFDVEGWSIDHDDEHSRGEMALAAGSYAIVAGFNETSRVNFTSRNRDGERTPWPNWPWSPEWWKPKDRRRDLVRAGTLIVAEIERLDRNGCQPDLNEENPVNARPRTR